MPVTASRTYAARSRPLAALRATALEHLFQSWRGRSGRRYICSVHRVADEAAFDCGRAVIVAVRRTSSAPEIAFVFQPARDGCAFAAWAEQARRCGATEFHVHLLAETRAARDAVADDLRPAPLLAV
jgi:hypothetical protein